MTTLTIYLQSGKYSFNHADFHPNRTDKYGECEYKKISNVVHPAVLSVLKNDTYSLSKTNLYFEQIYYIYDSYNLNIYIQTNSYVWRCNSKICSA
jgi:hypothetical protein